MKYFLASITFITILLSVLLLSPRAQAASFDPFPVCKSNPDSTLCQEAKKPQNPNGTNSIYGPGSILAKATSLISIIVGVASVIMVIIGGLKYILSGGDSGGRRQGDASGLNSARNTILYALIGVVIAVAAQAIVVLVINRL